MFGKTNLKENINEFVGKITIEEIKEFTDENFGIDDEYKNSGIKKQGSLSAKYEFYENKNQKHSGYFSGILKSKFYLNKNDSIKYNNINIQSDAYFNNAFVGTWTKYNSSIERTCNWGDFRVPNSSCDFDIGAGEFSVSEKYIYNGWLSTILTKKTGSMDINESKLPKGKIIKDWWE